jgi:hypothetical protein
MEGKYREGGQSVRIFIGCFLYVVWYTLGITVLCGLAVEGCYRLCFRLMGQRRGRGFWLATSFLGTPVHESGHALMCLLFGHRIERMRLFPNRGGVAMVQHTYNRKNVYATMGNLFIGVGPIFTGLAVILAVLALVYPASLGDFYAAGNASGAGAIELLFDRMWQLFRGLLLEATRPVWVRIVAIVVLFSVTLHVRLSTADIRGMLRGLPHYLVLCALVSAAVGIIGQGAYSTVLGALASFGGTVLMLFGLIFLIALLQLALILLYRALSFVFAVIFAKAPPA